MSFLPITREDMEQRGWDQLDFLYISGDAYVDHPSFGHAIITRLLESEGYKVGIIAQPDWKSSQDFMTLGRPKYAVLISSGVIDSMVNHYTATKKPRSEDQYSPGGKAGMRPDRAVIVYANKAREVFKDTPIIIGGIEASLRRFAHYDYWDNKIRRSILLDSKADLLIYGMGEKPILEIAKELESGTPVNEINNIRGTVYISSFSNVDEDIKQKSENFESLKDSNSNTGRDKKNKISKLPSFEEVSSDPMAYAKAFKIQYDEQDAITGNTLVQKHGDRFVIQNPPTLPMSVSEMDRVYALPYERTYHPIYEKEGGIPAIREVEFSITSHRGCYGGCSFCALNFHQGRAIQSRSQASILNEAKKLTWAPGFKGYIHDIGGPTANFRHKACEKQVKSGTCKGKQCLHPEPCKNLIVDHSEYLGLLKKLREMPGVKKVFIRSGIRYDYLMLDKNDDFFYELCEHHVSGQLKVAPEHVVDRVLDKMGKPTRKVYDKFVKKFYEINKKINKEQYLVPYMISGHPGSDLNAAIELAEYLRDMGYTPEQVQDFYPTPGTLSTCMYYTGIDPRTMRKVYVPRTPREKAMQRALLQYRKKENYILVHDALVEAGREDLIGFGKKCLIRPKGAARFAEKRREEKNKRDSNKKDIEKREYGKRDANKKDRRVKDEDVRDRTRRDKGKGEKSKKDFTQEGPKRKDQRKSDQRKESSKVKKIDNRKRIK
ncbi:MAG: YgiQ family radical SAM protein [Clostridia bacterium]|nr:YgiQ family radical SAM protein [Clostridia bacterium]